MLINYSAVNISMLTQIMLSQFSWARKLRSTSRASRIPKFNHKKINLNNRKGRL